MIRRPRPDLSPRTKPYPHQVEAISFIRKREAVALFDEQGLGKTKIVLDALLGEISSGGIDGALIVCRNSLIPMWKNEILRHTHVRGVVLSGAPDRVASHYLVSSPFYLTSYSVLHRELPRLRQLLGVRRLAIVLDESHAVKNPRARATADIIALGPLSPKRVILTGTPIANYPEDLWSQFLFLDGGKALGDDFDTFRFDLDLGSGAKRGRVSSASLRRITELIRPLSIRRTKAGVLELPEKQYTVETVSLRGTQLKMYRSVRDTLRLEILGGDQERRTIEIESVLEKLLRLVQVASNPSLVSPSYTEEPAKFRLLRSLLRDVFKRGEKAVVWSQFVANVILLRAEYRDNGSLLIHGGLSVEERQRSVDKFQGQEDSQVLFAVPGAAREGLTLTAANNAIYLDRGFNLVDYLQSQDRIHRLGQERRCLITKLVAKGTIDEFVDEVLKRKWEIANAIQSGVEPKGRAVMFEHRDLVSVLGGR